MWPKYQLKILQFAEVKKYLAITDVQNFFDSVSFGYIRRKMTAISGSLQVVDLMLLLFENFILRDMYAPIVHTGIPTIDVDAPRLVGHSLLFDVDRHLSKTTDGNFARWLDDINFGVESVKEAREIIRDIDALLRKVGLRLGGGKTKILSFHQARRYLQADENQRLNVIENTIKETNKVSAATARRVCNGYFRFRKIDRYGHWSSVMLRYYRLITHSNRSLKKHSPSFNIALRRIEAFSKQEFLEITTTNYRIAIIRFWGTLNPTDARLKYYTDAFRQVQAFDDAVAFALAELICNIEPTTQQRKAFAQCLLDLTQSARSAGYYYGACWFLAKYGTQLQVVEFLNRTQKLWYGNYFFARQAVALWSMLPALNKASARIRSLFLKSHDPDISAVVDFIETLRLTKMADKSLRGYLPMNESIKSLDLRRAIVSSNVMRSAELDDGQRAKIAERIATLSSDNRIRAISGGGTAL